MHPTPVQQLGMPNPEQLSMQSPQGSLVVSVTITAVAGHAHAHGAGGGAAAASITGRAWLTMRREKISKIEPFISASCDL